MEVGSPSRAQLIVNYFEFTIPQIAMKYGVANSTISRWFKALSIPRRLRTGFPKYAKPSREILEADYTKATSARQLDSKYNVPQGTVMYWLKSYGIPRRSRGFTAISPLPKFELQHLYLALGLSTCKIGELYNVSCHTIRKWLIHYRIPRFSTSVTDKRNWAKPAFRDKQMLAVMEGLQRRPTRPEQQVIDAIEQYGLPYKYTGDGSFIIGGIAPDFVNVNGAKVAIEVFGDYWHTTRVKCVVQTEQGRRARLAEYGWGLVVLWENELRQLTSQQIAQRISESQNKDKEVSLCQR